MREIFDRHAERLAPEERRAIWERVAGSRARASRTIWPRAVPAIVAAAAVVIAVLAVTVLRREPKEPERSVAARLDKPSENAERSVPERERLPQQFARPGRENAPSPDIASRAEPGVPSTPHPDTSGVRALIDREVGALKTSPAVPSPLDLREMGVVTGRVVDSQNQPVAYANVVVKGSQRGTLSNEDGTYRIGGLPPATYTLVVSRVGGDRQVREGIRVERGETTSVDVQFQEMLTVKTLDEVEVRSVRRSVSQSSATRQSISAEKLRELPADHLRDAVRAKSGVVSQGSDPHFRGGRGNEVRLHLEGLPAVPPVVPTTGGTKLPNDEPYDSMFFKNYGVNPFIATDEDALSTFAVDVDAASYTLARRYLELGHLPPADAVRVEEFVNFFPQGYSPFESEDFRILIDGAPSPFGQGYHLLRIGLKGREIAERNRKPARLTFVIDVSGSMDRENRLELVKRALRLLVDRLRGADRVGIVVYGSVGRVVLEPLALGGQGARAGRQRILDVIERLRSEGSTNAEQGLRLGYEMARLGYGPEAINRIVLCSDGVANVGLTGPESILAQVRTEADRGIQLTTIGFGMGNYNDVLMEQLADKGDGNHYYVDDIDEAHRVFVENLTGTLQIIAKDAKVQVEFDSTRVLRYRLLGFENRDVADRDFRNDRVDAGEIGAGHEVTALYEVKLAPGATEGTLATVRLRYARPEQEGAGAPQVREIEQRFDAASLARRFEDAAPRFRMDAAVAECAEILKGSYWAREGRLSDVLSVARIAARGLRDKASAEFVSLVERAAALSKRTKRGEGGEER